MQSSATVTLRAFVMLACAVGIPIFAMSGASWSEILKKFQNLRWPAVVEFASASTPSTPPPTLNLNSEPVRPASLAPALESPPTPSAPALAGSALQDATLAPPMQPADTCDIGKTTPSIDDIPKHLKQMGATYYVLESWGNEQQLYRFFCKMAVAGNDNYTHCFEATDADPRQAMLNVLQQVESWRETAAHGG